MIEAGSQMVNHFTREYAKPWWNETLFMVLNSLKQQDGVILWKDGILALLEKPEQFRIKIADTLSSPF
jgi:sulfur transfer complex TusBCD TusB component (DsrH family)